MTTGYDALETALQAVEHGQKAGADRCEAYVQTESRRQLEVHDGSLERLQQASTRGLGLRVEVDGRVALVHSTDFTRPAIASLASKAVEIARSLNTVSEPLQITPPCTVNPHLHQDPTMGEEKVDTTTAWLLRAERALEAVPGIVDAVSISWQQSEGTVALANSAGHAVAEPRCGVTVTAEALAERDGEQTSGSCYFEAPSRAHLQTPEWVGRIAAQRAVELLGARTVPSVKVPVIFTPWVGWTLLVWLSAALRGDHVVQGRSYFANALGKSVASPGVSLRDKPLDLRGPGHRGFDAEGTPTRDLSLIEHGVLGAYLTNRASASKLGIGEGGNATRDSHTQAPSIGTSNLHLEPGSLSPAEIIGGTERGLLLSTLSGWWLNLSPATDVFAAAAMGLWIEDGAIAYPVRGITVAGTVRQMIKDIDLVGNDLEIRGTLCTPTFRVAEMSVSGT